MGLLVFPFLAWSPAVSAAENETPAEPAPIDGIRDNSMLIEEAYNQEAGVVQHIMVWQYARRSRIAEESDSWEFGFIQEWPIFSASHQFAISVPYTWLDETVEGENTKASGVGDVALQYRYQVLFEKGFWPAISPGFALMVPTGDSERGFGNGEVAYGFSLPISKTLNDRAYINLNGGLEYVPLGFPQQDLLSYRLGGSFIYALTRHFHFLLEAMWMANHELETLEIGGVEDYERRHVHEVLLNPGLRTAFDLPWGVQVVPAVGFPIGLTDDSPDWGTFFYLSIEHPFTKSAGEKR